MEIREHLEKAEGNDEARLRVVSREVSRKSQSLLDLVGALFYLALIAATLYLLVRVSF
jgi:hypothetical protein